MTRKLACLASGVSFIGSDLPFPKTKSAATAADDPRTPIAERYSSRDEYLKKFRASADKVAADRFLLPEDIDALVKRSGEEWDWIASRPTPDKSASSR